MGDIRSGPNWLKAPDGEWYPPSSNTDRDDTIRRKQYASKDEVPEAAQELNVSPTNDRPTLGAGAARAETLSGHSVSVEARRPSSLTVGRIFVFSALLAVALIAIVTAVITRVSSGIEAVDRASVADNGRSDLAEPEPPSTSEEGHVGGEEPDMSSSTTGGTVPASESASPVDEWTLVGPTLAAVDSESNVTLSSPPGEMRWFGATIPVGIQADCSYALSLDARVVEGDLVTGYAIAPGAFVENEVPYGDAFQYDLGLNGIRLPSLPDDFSNDIVLHYAVDGSPLVMDNSWHHWDVRVEQDRAVAQFDGKELAPIEVGPGCELPIYVRVWNGSVQLRNLVIG
jgi:hypothetical protein